MTDSSLPTTPEEIKAWISGLDAEDFADLTAQVLGGRLAAQLGLGDPFDTVNPPIDLPPPPEEPVVLTFTIELTGAKPRIWRRLRLPGEMTLDQVHLMLQAAMGWTDSHLHRFTPGKGSAYQGPHFVTEFDEDEGDEGTREEEVRLDQVLREPKDRLTYTYDFGDDWEHLLTLESVSPLTEENRKPICIKGANAGPPEDVGGIYGHVTLAEWLRAGAPPDDVPDPFEDAEHAHGWLPDDYDPDHFDPAEVTEAMQLWASGAHVPWHGLPEPLTDVIDSVRGPAWRHVMTWLTALDSRDPVALDEAGLRTAAAPWRAVLDAVGDGTKLTAAGYLPPALVQQIADTTGISQWWIGKANREDLTYPVLHLRAAAQAFGLLRKSKGTLAPTARAKKVSHDDGDLVGAVLERIPAGKGFDEQAGWLFLLGLAAGEGERELQSAVGDALADIGWRVAGGAPLHPHAVSHGIAETRDAIESMAGGGRHPDRDLMVRLAQAALFGIRSPE